MERLDQVKAAASRVFKSRDGELVLKYLREQYYDCRIKDEHLVRQVGRRDVVQMIHFLMEESNE